MTGSERVRALTRLYLIMLRGELARRGATCDLLGDCDGQMWLCVFGPDPVPAARQHPGYVSLAFIDGEWWCCWPGATVICPVTSFTRAAEAIISGLASGDGCCGAGGNVADLAAWRMLRHARLSASSPGTRPGE